jgi:phosphopantothenoylcysteine decarboxylase / phosphopantothenate---cysteine ligase
MKVLLGITGGIAAYKAMELVRRLGAGGCRVRCALSRSARAFVTPLSLEVLSGHAVHEQEYLTATGRGEESHIVAAQWADVVCVAPATAHLMARLALGLADDFLTTTLLAFDGPLVLAPAMHSSMWRHPAVAAHAETLRRRGVRLVGPVEGALASGEHGIGRLADPEAIVRAVLASAGVDATGAEARKALAGRRVLISAGPTHEPIDPVRYLGNRSSGKMGFALAAEAAARGAHTTLVAGPVALATPPGVERVDVATALEMRDAVNGLAAGADLIVMAAAVADFRPRDPGHSKLKRAQGVPVLDLEENPDILAGLQAVAPDALRVGFAAETEPAEAEAYAKLERKGADFLVWNDVSRPGIGFGADDNEVTLYRRSGGPRHFGRRSKRRLASSLLDVFGEALRDRERQPAQTAG